MNKTLFLGLISVSAFALVANVADAKPRGETLEQIRAERELRDQTIAANQGLDKDLSNLAPAAGESAPGQKVKEFKQGQQAERKALKEELKGKRDALKEEQKAERKTFKDGMRAEREANKAERKAAKHAEKASKQAEKEAKKANDLAPAAQ